MIDVAGEAWDQYRNAFRKDVQQLLAWGYFDARALIHSECEEQDITGYICEAIERRLDDVSTPERFVRYEVAEDNPIPGEDRTGKRRRRADIRIKSTMLRPRPRYVLEGKRLRRQGHGISTYVGVDGLRRFVDATSYSSYALEFAMVGYVQSETPRDWLDILSAALSRDIAVELRIVSIGELTVDTDPLVHTLLSQHTRASGEPFEVCHFLLDCT